MNANFITIVLIGMSLVSGSFGSTFEDQFHERLMEVGWKQSLTELDRYSKTEQQHVLERALLAFGRDHIPRRPDRQECYEKAQTTLLSFPGHATYYQEKIEAMRAEVLAHSKKSGEEIAKIQDNGMEVVNEWDYSTYCETVAFPTLSHLPSPETVAVLGHFLNDPEGRDGKNITGRSIKLEEGPGRLYVNAEGAAIAIRKLGIEHPPFPPYDDRGMRVVRDGEVDTWKNWWNEVKDGRRTYRFKGSNIEYGADGPASNEVIERAAMNRKRDEERRAGKRFANPGNEPDAPAKTPAKPSTIAGILAACALVAGALWYFLRGRRTV